MDETEFFRLYGAYDSFEDTLVFGWFHWRKQQGLEWNPGGEPYKVEYEWKTNEVVATSKFGEDRFSAEELYTKIEDRVSMLWYDNYYDGPLTGVGVYKGNYVYFMNHDHSHENLSNVWTYDLYELSEEEYQHELGWHNYFLDAVKNSNDKAKFDKYYKDRGERDKPDYSKNKHLGEFDECLFDRTYKENE